MSLPATYTRYVFDEIGAPEVIQAVTAELPRPAAGEVLLRLSAVGVNPIDMKLRSGIRPSAPGTRALGFDGAGVVAGLGAGVSEFQIGQRVAVSWASGSYGEYMIAPIKALVPLAPNVSDAQAAAAGIPAGTAYQALRSLGVAAGEVLLIHGGSGAVGQAAIQFARLSGAQVIASCSKARAAQVASLGAIPVTYGADLEAEIADALAGRNIDVILDAAGGDQARDVSLKLLTNRQRFATVVQGADADAHGYRGFLGGSAVALTELEQLWRNEGVVLALTLAAAGSFSFEIGHELALSDAVLAHRMLDEGASGKIILKP